MRNLCAILLFLGGCGSQPDDHPADGGADLAPDLGGGDGARDDGGGGGPWVADSDQPIALALDADTVYWVDYAGCDPGAGKVKKAPKSGGAPTVLATGQGCPMAIAVDGANVYWIAVGDGAVRAVPKAGGAVATLAGGETFFDSGVFLALDADALYYGAQHDLRRLPKSNGAPTTLSSVGGNVTGVAVDGGRVFFADFQDQPNGGVFSVPTGGGAPTVIATGECLPFQVALDAARVYWVNEACGGAVVAAGRDGAGHAVLAANQGPGLLGIAVDATTAWFADKTSVRGVPLAGGAVTDPGLPSWGAVAVDDQAVWSGAMDGVYRHPR